MKTTIHGHDLTIEQVTPFGWTWTLDDHEDGSGCYCGTIAEKEALIGEAEAVDIAKDGACEALSICNECGTHLDSEEQCPACRAAAIEDHYERQRYDDSLGE
jgi:hypothetical protein